MGMAGRAKPDPALEVEIRITGKPTGASVVADNVGLADPAAVERRREQWRTALESLKSHLSP